MNVVTGNEPGIIDVSMFEQDEIDTLNETYGGRISPEVSYMQRREKLLGHDTEDYIGIAFVRATEGDYKKVRPQ